MSRNNSAQKYYVSRQHYYYSGEYMVEITSGGSDYAGADELVSKYYGEGMEYSDPREAVEIALEIARKWGEDNLLPPYPVGAGNTGGMGMEIEPDSEAELKLWADRMFAKQPKCSQCGGVLAQSFIRLDEYAEYDVHYCSEYCAESAAQFDYEQMQEECDDQED